MRGLEVLLKNQLASRARLAALTLALLACGEERARSPEESGDGGAQLDAGVELPLDATLRPLDAGATVEGSAPLAEASSRDASSPLAELDDALQRQIDELVGLEPPLRGLTAVVVHERDGIVYQRAFGAFALDRVFLLGSASALLSAGVLLRLADQGLLDVDAPIADVLADWGRHKPGVTTAQLLSNSAGLPSTDALRMAEQSPEAHPELAPHPCQRRAVGALASCGRAIYEDDQAITNRGPDTTYTSGGSAWQLAGALAQQVAGKSWSQLLRETYVEPCALTSLGYTNEFDREPLMHPGFYDGDPSVLAPTDNPSIEGGGFATAQDFAQVLLMHLRDGQCPRGRVLSSESVARMRENRLARWGGTTGSPVSPGYGLGWHVSERSGVRSAPGIYGFYALIDPRRSYGLIVAIELDVVLAAQIVFSIKPVLDRMYPADLE